MKVGPGAIPSDILVQIRRVSIRVCFTVITNESGLAQVGIDLCLEGLDVDFVVVDLRSVGEFESRLGLFDGGDWHLELIQIVVDRAVPVFGIAEVSCQCGERICG